MTILQSLAAFYDRLDRRGQGGPAIIPAPGLKPVEIDYILEIDSNGAPVALKQRAIPEGRRRAGKLMMPGTVYNPEPKKGESAWEDLSFGGRTSGRRSFLFWDKSSYVFGVAGKKAKSGNPAEPDITEKSKQDHAAFVAAHRSLLVDTEVPAFQALLRFVDSWQVEDWLRHGFPVGALDRNIAFEVSGTRMRIDQMPAARELAKGIVASRTNEQHCLVSGTVQPYAAKHPLFRGVVGAQSSGAMIVSFNAESFISFGADKAATAPVSEDAAFRYGAALNWLLDRDNGRMFRLGETTVVYWADEKSVPGGDAAACNVEDAVAWELTDDTQPVEAPTDDAADSADDVPEPDEPDVDRDDVAQLDAQAQNVRHLRKAPDPSALDPATRLHILGLSPNAGRIAVRFWLVDTWGAIGRNIERHKSELRIEPPDQRNADKKAYALLYEVAAQRDAKNIPPRLGGELVRAILTGAPYPQTLFANVVGRIRTDKSINAARAGLCRAIVTRNYGRNVPVALDPDSVDSAYNLGRLFAAYEYAEKNVADRGATIRSKYIGAASATPRRVFPILMRGYEHNATALSKSDGNQRGSGINASKAVTQILSRFSGEAPFPAALRLEEQGRFFVGYYHQMQSFYTKRDGDASDTASTEGDNQ